MALQAKLLPNSFNPNFFDALVSHFVQSWRWGVVRKQTGVDVIRVGFMDDNLLKSVAQISLHPIPKTGKNIGLLSKCAPYSKEELEALAPIAKEHNIVALRMEPDIEDGASWSGMTTPGVKKAPRNYYIPYNFLIDLTKSEEELLAAMESKTRYNIRVAEKHDVVIEQRNDEAIWDEFIKLQKETASRQKFYLHSDEYYRTVFKAFVPQNQATFLVAKHPDGAVLTIWFLMMFKKTITYLYGASSQEHKDAMANNLIAWEAMKLGKNLGMTTFDFGGTTSLDAPPSDPHYGFHKFKKGFGGRHVSYVGTYDLVIDPLWYRLFSTADNIRWTLLRLIKR